MFNEKDLQLLGDVFTLARLQVVTATPNDEAGIINIINFKAAILKQMEEANKALEGLEANKPEEIVIGHSSEEGGQLSE
jgi:hypothetical protein